MDDKFWIAIRIMMATVLPVGLALASYEATQDVYAAILAALVTYMIFWKIIMDK